MCQFFTLISVFLFLQVKPLKKKKKLHEDYVKI